MIYDKMILVCFAVLCFYRIYDDEFCYCVLFAHCSYMIYDDALKLLLLIYVFHFH